MKADDLGTGSVGKRALATNSVGKAEARPRSIGISELRDGAVTTAKLEHPIYSARVAASGKLAQEVGATTAKRAATGSYRVEFGQDVGMCSYQVTAGDVNDNLTTQAALDPTNHKTVVVSLRNAKNGARTNGVFQVAVFC